MSTGLIAISVVVGIGLILGLFYISHTIEQQKAKRALMIANLSDKAHRLQLLIDRVPPAYMPTDLKVLILNQIKARFEKLLEIVPGNTKFKKNLDSTTIQISDAQASSEKHPPPQFKTPQEAAEIKASLQELSKAVEAFVKNGTLQASAGRQHLAKIQQAFIEANVNYLTSQADEARRDQKPKLAIHYYQKAIAELSKRNKGNVYGERIAKLKDLVTQLGGQEEAAPEAATENGENELTKGVENLLEEDNSWKKKYF